MPTTSERRAQRTPVRAAGPDPAAHEHEHGHEHLIEEFSQAMQEFQRSLDLLDQGIADRLGLNRTDLRCLELLFGPEPLSPGDLARAAHLTTGGVTTAIDRLERAGYATRERDTADRRRTLLHLTARSAAVAAEIYQPIAEASAVHLHDLDAETLDRLIGFLRAGARLQREHAARLAGVGEETR
ncbi:MAG TPA: MarR family transcriptional regulator [Actinocrinis sp.]|nr:MarR family transcriptional regulator [Actinocrinis sp.]